MNRIAYLLQACQGRKVLHIGCCDTPFCREKIATGELLHMRLKNVARELWGLDLTEDDLAYMRSALGVDNLLTGNCEKIDEVVGQERFDVVVAGEVVEHLANPGLFLSGAREILAASGELVISVPNGLAFRRGLKSLSGRETVHPDHSYYFSRKTIRHLVESAGFRVLDMRGYRMPLKRFLGAYLTDLIASAFSEWACEGIMLTATPLE